MRACTERMLCGSTPFSLVGVGATTVDLKGGLGSASAQTKDGITVKMDLLSKDGDKKMRMSQELTNLKVEKQDPKLFEIPPGYTKNDVGSW